ncbi:chorismate--pyruvate lyase family protein [Candidatus Venteria ishoeyi]|uniref:Chorismate pyruvate-lyase n=1 Tax=Candidatus Venteria ishoeyi TaxID=1899563 RepID=A0A1H6F9S7_9GAMM|nr:chorismate pyruvate-lyase family protein [Candidatus Venteria ishoeyi]MDM8545720.1 chorismate pyruvate-lyase family protein [Candidatus Venteria ishoeyi]SEH06847.1 Chorismate pyruvate-lyase [Candidatus Venteria ishoeyi]
MAQNQLNLTELSAFQRVILTTDGTLTDILEAYLLDHIRVIKLSEKALTTRAPISALEIEAATEIVERKILLQGQARHNWLYAESIIVPARLGEQFRRQLLESNIPIGKLWVAHKLETFKESIVSAREPAGKLAGYFNIRPEDPVLYRTYRVFSQQQLIMMITEKFPESFFV